LYDNDNIIGFCGILHQPCRKYKKLKRCSRLVILPDYQGIGLGTKFLNEIAKYYSNMGYDFTIVTSAKNMIMALRNSSKWTMIRYSVAKCTSNKSKIDKNRSSKRNNCKTASFMYKNN
jgi:GNAT superfamily N-acetyltransferase